MIKDLEILYDISPLFEKKVVIWGIGYEGQALLEEMKAMGAGKWGIILCDSDENKWGKWVGGCQIMPPITLKEYIVRDLHNLIICIMVNEINAQNEILKKISTIVTYDVDICTSFAVKWGIYYGLKSSYMDETYRRDKLIEHENRRKEEKAVVDINAIRYFAFAPLHNDEMILVYQPGKAGSSSVYHSIRKYGRYVLHSHSLRHVGYTDMDLRELVDRKAGKIISLVREPISRTIASMWQNIPSVKFFGVQADMDDIEKYFFREGFENFQFEWFNQEMKKVFDIDIYEYPFDKKRGYQIIKAGNIELLLMKMEKLNNLETVIGQFLGINDFKLEGANVGEEKPYRFAYQEYKKRFLISNERLDAVYKKNKYVKHFYTEEECEQFLKKYKR